MTPPRITRSRTRFALSLLALGLLSSGLAQNLRLTINGRPAGSAITLNGQAYVPVSALKAAGVRVTQGAGVLSLVLPGAGQVGGTAGGANQVAALSGCLGQTFFNGVWRVTLSNLRLSPDADDPKWLISVEVRNATKNSLQPTFGGLDPDGEHLSFLSSDGTPLEWGTYDSLAGQKLGFATLPPGGVWKGTLSVHDPEGASEDRPPTKLLWQIKPAELPTSAKLPWNVKDPSLRVDLTCQK